eukprot:scaffold32295_cov74-Phaeocystis_antarctica.AAC.9
MLRICVCIQQSAAESTTASSASATVGNTHAHGGALLPASRGESEGAISVGGSRRWPNERSRQEQSEQPKPATVRTVCSVAILLVWCHLVAPHVSEAAQATPAAAGARRQCPTIRESTRHDVRCESWSVPRLQGGPLTDTALNRACCQACGIH